MKIIGLVGSPRKNGNTDVLVQKVLEGVREKGGETNIFYLNELSIKGCQACLGCKKAGKCVLNDDLAQVLAAINEADGVVVGSPIYFGRFTAQTALFMDRLYGYLRPDFTSSLGDNKKAVLVFTQGQPDDGLYQNTITATLNSLQRVGFSANPRPIIGAGLREAGAAQTKEQLLQEAYNIGSELVHA